jgi:hypothetical protein
MYSQNELLKPYLYLNKLYIIYILNKLHLFFWHAICNKIEVTSSRQTLHYCFDARQDKHLVSFIKCYGMHIPKTNSNKDKSAPISTSLNLSFNAISYMSQCVVALVV